MGDFWTRSLFELRLQFELWLCSLVAQTSKASACTAGDSSLIPGSGWSPGEGNGNPPQHSCLENPVDGGAWEATVHGVAKSQTWLSDFTLFFDVIIELQCSTKFVVFGGIFAILSVIAKEQQKKMKNGMWIWVHLCFWSLELRFWLSR